MEYKRQYRQMSDETKAKISQSLKGRSKSYSHAQHISSGMRSYWSTVKDKPTDENNQ